MSNQPPESTEHRRWWNILLSRLFQREKRPGDVISARIGDDARGVVVGKNIIQIGTLVVPTLPVLVFPVLPHTLVVIVNSEDDNSWDSQVDFSIELPEP